jgi:hypothetical protein
MLARPVALACVLALALAGCAAGGDGARDRGADAAADADAGAAAARAPVVGVAANTLGWGPRVGHAQDVVGRTGVRLLREELSWYLVEPRQGRWRWERTDRLMVAAAHRRMQLLVLLHGAPRWAGRPAGALPTRTAAYARYVTAVVQRYGPHGSFWRRHPTLPRSSAPVWFELWNEPFFARPVRSTIDARRYAALAAAGLRAGRAADPGARFLVAADTSWEGQPEVSDRWLDRLDRLAPGLLAGADGIAAHPYSDRVSVSLGEVAHLRAALDRRGIRAPIWVTEVGWSTCSVARLGCQTERRQAAALDTFLGSVLARPRSDVAKVIVYNMHDLGSSPPDREQHFGMLRLNGSRKPSWSVLHRHATAAHEAVRAAGRPQEAAAPGR